jgi:hypothetical protein
VNRVTFKTLNIGEVAIPLSANFGEFYSVLKNALRERLQPGLLTKYAGIGTFRPDLLAQSVRDTLVDRPLGLEVWT